MIYLVHFPSDDSSHFKFGCGVTPWSSLSLSLQVMRPGNNQRPLTPGQGQQSQQESLAAAAAANPALAYAGMPGQWLSSVSWAHTGFYLHLQMTSTNRCPRTLTLYLYPLVYSIAIVILLMLFIYLLFFFIALGLVNKHFTVRLYSARVTNTIWFDFWFDYTWQNQALHSTVRTLYHRSSMVVVVWWFRNTLQPQELDDLP